MSTETTSRRLPKLRLYSRRRSEIASPKYRFVAHLTCASCHTPCASLRGTPHDTSPIVISPFAGHVVPTNQKLPPRFQLVLRDAMFDEPEISILYPRRCVSRQPHDRQTFAHPSRETPRRAGICSLHQRRCPNGVSHPLSETTELASLHSQRLCDDCPGRKLCQ